MPTLQIQHDYQIYADQLASLGHGLALWEPAPSGYDKVNVADVGYIQHGCFRRLFNAALPKGHVANEYGLPKDYIPLDWPSRVSRTQWRQPRVPCALHTQNINSKEGRIGISGNPSWMHAGGRLQFESTASEGAILLTNHKTYREDAVPVKLLKEYALRHHESWLEFASERGLDVRLEDLMLVTGYDVSSEYAMAAFSNASGTVGIDFEVGATPVASVSLSVSGTWQSTTSVHHNFGPQTRVPPSSITTRDSHSTTSGDSHPATGGGRPLETTDDQPLTITTSISVPSEVQANTNAAPTGYNQCLFLRRVQIRKRAGIFPTAFQAAAGPHDLGSGHRRDEYAPALTQAMGTPTSRLSESDDDNGINVSPRFRDPLDPIFRYIFANSPAHTAIVDDMDLTYLLKFLPSHATETVATLVQRVAPDIKLGTDDVASVKTASDAESPFGNHVDIPQAARIGYDDLEAPAPNSQPGTSTPAARRHARNATIEISRPQQKRPVRSSTAPGRPSTLPITNADDSRRLVVNEDIKAYLNPSQAHHSWAIVPPTLLARAPTPEIPFVPLLTNPSGPFQEQIHTSHSDVPPSEGSTSLSISSEPLTPSDDDEAHSGSNLFIKYGSDGAVKAATLPGLVERLITDSKDFSKDLEFKETFLTSYRAFSTAEQVFSLLVERFEVVSSPQYTGGLQQSVGVRYSVLTVLELWMQRNHVEANDIPLLERMRTFATSIQASSLVEVFRDSAGRLIELIDDNVDMLSVTRPTNSFVAPTMVLPFQPSDVSELELALVLTSIEGDRYRKVKEWDFINWLERTTESNNLSSCIAENEILSFWAQRSILKPNNTSQRAANFNYFLRVAEECRKLRNFSSSCVLFQSLTTSLFTGLKRTSILDKSNSKIIVEARKIVSSGENFGVYRKALNGSSKSRSKRFRKSHNVLTETGSQWDSTGRCIPWLRVHLHDLKATHEAHSPFVDADDHSDLINFNRYQCLRDRIRHILSHEVPLIKPANNTRHADIQKFVESQLRSLVVDDALRDWLKKRGSKLAWDEKIDYDQYTPELEAAGFARRNTTTKPSRAPGGSSSKSKHTLSSQVLPLGPQGPLSPQTPGDGHGRMGSVHNSLPGTSAEPKLHILEDESSSDFDLWRRSHLDQNYETAFDKNSIYCLDGRISLPSEHPVAAGGFANVQEGFLGTQKVAIKTIRHISSAGRGIEESKLIKRLWREYSVWTRISHPVVLPCLGFSYDFSPPSYVVPSLISPWMANGTALTYLENYPDKDRLDVLVAVGDGLAYLHDQQPAIIHGDLRGANILISDSGRPCLSEFGLARIIGLEEMTPSPEEVGSLRWMSPELLRDESPGASSDVWAYGMTILEIMSGNHPYHKIKSDVIVLAQIQDGQAPSRPQDTKVSNGLTDEVWAICQHCWIVVPSQRPSMHEVFSKISRITR